MSDSESPSAPRADGLPAIAPDFIEQDYPDYIDNIVPTRGYEMTPMIALGGSAGGFAALEEFFKAMPDNSGMSFVVILHLSPTHESNMAAMIARWTSMPVVQAEDRQKTKPNSVYVIPPGKLLSVTDGHLRLVDLDRERGKRVTVDLFFRSLADTHGPHSAAIVLSGADGDGALGLKRIKERGGLTIAQDPNEAEYCGMPRTAIDTGMVDWVLHAQNMPARLMSYFSQEKQLKLPPEEGPQPAKAVPLAPDQSEAALREVLSFLRSRTGRDFSYYKRATIVRRISRRMQINGVEDVPGYLAFLRAHPGEAGALLQDLLISVTNFFRDRDSFAALEAQIPKLFEGKSGSDSVRVWVPACATGEEAYSIAILLQEHAGTIESSPALQVFACDLDDDAIQKARAGVYPEASAADVSEERLRRFFLREPGGYRVKRELREMVLFATHDLLKDPPFSRMDLISCRNLMIYLNRGAQLRMLELFHFSMTPKGLLFLGSSESVDETNPLFRVLDKKHRIFAPIPSPKAGLPLLKGSTTLSRTLHGVESRNFPVVHGRGFFLDPVMVRGPLADTRSSLVELHLKLIERFSPPSVVINAEHEVVHLSENAGSLLTFVGGEPTMNLLRLIHPMLRVELRAAFFRVAETNQPVEACGVPVEIDGETRRVDLRVAPAPDLAPGYLLVTFDKNAPRPAAAGAADGDQAVPPDPLVKHLERELDQTKRQLRDTIEQYEASTEELKASNEELQAMNEELRSATEELETSREELQSINEELTTVNQELKAKVEELGHANSDLQNLMASTSIATVFLDRSLKVMRYTPSAVDLFRLIPGDVGRPLADLRHRLEYPGLLADAAEVLSTLVPIEREVRDDGRWQLARLQPYRTLEDHIGGVVLTLVDVTELRQASEALAQSEERMRLIVETAKDYAIFATDMDRVVTIWNSGAEAILGYRESEIVGHVADIIFTSEDREEGIPEQEMAKARNEGHAADERWHVRKSGEIFFGSGSVRPIRNKKGELIGFLKIMRDLTEAKRMQETLHQQVDELTRFNNAAVGRETRMIELKEEINSLRAEAGQPPRYLLEGEPGMSDG